MIKIIIYKSSSKYYDQVCLFCEKFNNYSYTDDRNIIEIDLDELNEKRKQFNSI